MATLPVKTQFGISSKYLEQKITNKTLLNALKCFSESKFEGEEK